ncbi:hypothetical protein [Streptomyces sp. CoH17]|uniref:hypothetical protein n=1 Tax=Streptomyces sp. CoH17 TaxID=2992806 RepID=UPI00226F53B6|nr:hypothetical protein [Streptomyces sp. CoH17]
MKRINKRTWLLELEGAEFRILKVMGGYVVLEQGEPVSCEEEKFVFDTIDEAVEEAENSARYEAFYRASGEELVRQVERHLKKVARFQSKGTE